MFYVAKLLFELFYPKFLPIVAAAIVTFLLFFHALVFHAADSLGYFFQLAIPFYFIFFVLFYQFDKPMNDFPISMTILSAMIWVVIVELFIFVMSAAELTGISFQTIRDCVHHIPEAIDSFVGTLFWGISTSSKDIVVIKALKVGGLFNESLAKKTINPSLIDLCVV